MASARVWVLAAVLLACLLAGPTDGWRRRRRRRCPPLAVALPGAINSWDQTFTFQCPPGQAVSRVQSVHCNTAEDRVWKFECKSVPGLSSFASPPFWSSWINTFDGYMSFTCPFNSVVTGFQSEHSNSHEDRRWKLRCSRKNGMVTTHEYLTPYVNNWDGSMNYYVPNDYYIRGMHGYHDNSKEDRLYRFDLCKVNLGIRG